MGRAEKVDAIRRSFGARLKKARTAAGLTQQGLADLADCSAFTLSKIETGVNFPTSDILISLAIALGTSPDHLLGWVADEHPREAKIGELMSTAEALPDDWITILLSVAHQAAR